ncbi:hypothetical protein C8F04DRAFT_1236428 [Mycena alexandri]|uniref:F-box domain-containing protein n=1 Tax=Mycena alexandri TaxID=1745969 RepID=A0AAD6SQG7_9AGAR|nr:hypothetical protein C8F04DRAFT_1236428 [Mycena alexandri]
MPFERLGFLDLVEDLILLVMGDYCDVKSVVRIGQTSKYLHRLAFSHAVWLSLVAQLVERRIIDLRPGNENLETDQLIREVKCTVHGPTTWSHPSIPPPNILRKTVKHFKRLGRRLAGPLASERLIYPSQSRRVVLHPQNLTGVLSSLWIRKVELLPGGEHVLFLAAGRLECWRVSEDKLVWTHVCAIRDTSVYDFAADIIKDNEVAICICQNVQTDPKPRKRFIEITTLDLNNGNSTLVLVIRAPDIALRGGMYNSCTVCGNMAAVVYDRRILLLINWLEHSYIVVETFTHELNSVVFIPHYIVLKLRQTLTACALASFDTLWAPVDGINRVSNYTLLEDCPIITLDDIPLQRPCSVFSRKDLWVYKSPTEHGVFRLWAYLHMVGSRTELLRGYELTVQASGISWECRGSTPTPEFSYPFGLLYSGHVVTGTREVLPPIWQGGTATIITLDQVARRSTTFHVSPYSGTVTCSTEEGEIILVSYD